MSESECQKAAAKEQSGRKAKTKVITHARHIKNNNNSQKVQKVLGKLLPNATTCKTLAKIWQKSLRDCEIKVSSAASSPSPSSRPPQQPLPRSSESLYVCMSVSLSVLSLLSVLGSFLFVYFCYTHTHAHTYTFTLGCVIANYESGGRNLYPCQGSRCTCVCMYIHAYIHTYVCKCSVCLRVLLQCDRYICLALKLHFETFFTFT